MSEFKPYQADDTTLIENVICDDPANRHIECITPGCDWTLGYFRGGLVETARRLGWRYSTRLRGLACGNCVMGRDPKRFRSAAPPLWQKGGFSPFDPKLYAREISRELK